MIILMNAAFMLYTTDYSIQHLGEPPTTLITLADQGFLAFFVVELALRISVHRGFFFCNNDMRWNLFDFVLVGIAIYDQVSRFRAARHGPHC